MKTHAVWPNLITTVLSDMEREIKTAFYTTLAVFAMEPLFQICLGLLQVLFGLQPNDALFIVFFIILFATLLNILLLPSIFISQLIVDYKMAFRILKNKYTYLILLLYLVFFIYLRYFYPLFRFFD